MNNLEDIRGKICGVLFSAPPERPMTISHLIKDYESIHKKSIDPALYGYKNCRELFMSFSPKYLTFENICGVEVISVVPRMPCHEAQINLQIYENRRLAVPYAFKYSILPLIRELPNGHKFTMEDLEREYKSRYGHSLPYASLKIFNRDIMARTISCYYGKGLHYTFQHGFIKDVSLIKDRHHATPTTTRTQWIQNHEMQEHHQTMDNYLWHLLEKKCGLTISYVKKELKITDKDIDNLLSTSNNNNKNSAYAIQQLCTAASSSSSNQTTIAVLIRNNASSSTNLSIHQLIDSFVQHAPSYLFRIMNKKAAEEDGSNCILEIQPVERVTTANENGKSTLMLQSRRLLNDFTIGRICTMKVTTRGGGGGGDQTSWHAVAIMGYLLDGDEKLKVQVLRFDNWSECVIELPTNCLYELMPQQVTELLPSSFFHSIPVSLYTPHKLTVENGDVVSVFFVQCRDFMAEFSASSSSCHHNTLSFFDVIIFDDKLTHRLA